MGEIYSTKFARVRKIDYKKNRTTRFYNIIVLKDNPTNSEFRQSLEFKSKYNSYIWNSHIKDFMILP
jgi:hypothetical protein